MKEIYIAKECLLYKKMYCHLFNAVTDAINVDNKCISDSILKNAQIKTEDIFMNSELKNSKNSIEDEINIFLLKLLVQTEKEKNPNDIDEDFIIECEDWIKEIQDPPDYYSLVNGLLDENLS